MSNFITHKTLSNCILHALLYYDIFNYPLTSQEVYQHLGRNHVTPEDVTQELNTLEKEGLVHHYQGYYTIQDDSALIPRRIKGNRYAQQILKVAERRASLIYQFPFVRGVMISGSLSKGYADKNSDADFFIITQPERLWIARTLLVLYKRIFLFNNLRFFCVNYFIDTNHLEIEERSLFTATELATLIPVKNHKLYQKLMEANSWVTNYFPNFRPAASSTIHKESLIKRTLEFIVNRCWNVKLEKTLMLLTLKRWKKLYGHEVDPSRFNMAFKTTAYASKSHPKDYHKKIGDLYTEKLNQFAKTHNLN